MNAFEDLQFNNPFVLAILQDSMEILSDIDIKPTAFEWPINVTLNEQQFYVQKLSFFLAHTLTWCKQLDLAIQFLSIYNYSENISSSRADHLVYNIENYLIRLNSVYDRILQLINATFHLCIDEAHVNHSVIVTNYKVVHRPKIQNAIKRIKKFLKNYSEIRNTLIHRHSYQEKELKQIELLYFPTLIESRKDDNLKSKLKTLRINYLNEYLREKKTEFSQINSKLAKQVGELFNLLHKEYEREKKRLA